MNEDIKGYEGIYSIDNLGFVYSYRRNKYLKPAIRERYMHVCLSLNGKHKKHYIHVLVANHFIGNCPKGHEINHKDTNKHNNYVHNLEYVTHKNNVRHSIKEGIHNSVVGKRDKTGRFIHRLMSNGKE